MSQEKYQMLETFSTDWLEELRREVIGPTPCGCRCALLAVSQAAAALSAVSGGGGESGGKDALTPALSRGEREQSGDASGGGAIECLEDLDVPCPNAIPVGGTFVCACSARTYSFAAVIG
jgi:hypothetical protein